MSITTKNYLLKFKVLPKNSLTSSRALLAAEIYEWSGKKLIYPMLSRLIKLKGEEFVRRCWAETKQENVREPHKIFMWKLKQIKVELKESPP